MRRHRQGQSTVEWALVISVVLVAIVAAAYAFVPSFSTAMRDAGRSMSEVYTTGDLAGS